jgi:hypothetical protein
VSLSVTDWAKCIVPASAVLWIRELWKLLRRRTKLSIVSA